MPLTPLDQAARPQESLPVLFSTATDPSLVSVAYLNANYTPTAVGAKRTQTDDLAQVGAQLFIWSGTWTQLTALGSTLGPLGIAAANGAVAWYSTSASAWSASNGASAGQMLIYDPALGPHWSGNAPAAGQIPQWTNVASGSYTVTYESVAQAWLNGGNHLDMNSLVNGTGISGGQVWYWGGSSYVASLVAGAAGRPLEAAVPPGPAGNVLTSNGGNWNSQPPATSVVTDRGYVGPVANLQTAGSFWAIDTAGTYIFTGYYEWSDAHTSSVSQPTLALSGGGSIQAAIAIGGDNFQVTHGIASISLVSVATTSQTISLSNTGGGNQHGWIQAQRIA